MAAGLIDIVQAIFVKRRNYQTLSDKEKDSMFFIFNRYMSKKFPKKAQALNKKGIDKSVALDAWYYDNKNAFGIPSWFWAGKKKEEVKGDFEKKDITRFLNYHELRMDDFDMLNIICPEDLKEEVKRLKKLEETMSKLKD